VSIFVRNLAEALGARDYRVKVLKIQADKMPVGLRNVGLALKSSVAVFRNRRGFDLVHLQQLHPQAAAVGILARALGKAVVLTIHGRSPRPSGVRGVAFDALEKIGVKIPHSIVSVAESLREQVGIGLVVPNAVPSSALRKIALTRDRVRHELDLGDDLVLAFVGRVDRDKGFLVLLDALRRALRIRPVPLKLIAIGPVNDDIRDELLRNPIPSVVLLGLQSEPSSFVAAADVFVLPSFREGLPLSLLEAMAMGIPAIATRVGDIPSVVLPGSTGWLVDPGDASGLASAILESVSNQKLRLSMGTRASRLVEDRFDLDLQVQTYGRLYMTLLKSHLRPH
jgi:glycosyltransferase involved in cell wall biosynthesis